VIPFFLFWVVFYFLLAAPAARRASAELAVRLGIGATWWQRWRFGFKHFWSFGRLQLDRVLFLQGRADLFEITFAGEELLRRALAAGRGVMLVTAHLGNWEALAERLTRLQTPVNVVMHDGVQPRLRATLEELTKGRHAKVLWTDGSPATAAGIVAALRRNEIVGMMGDRRFAGRGVLVTFLGGAVELPIGPFAAAAVAEAPVFYVFAVRAGPYRYAFHGLEAGCPAYGSRRSRQQDHRRWAQGYADRLEEFTRRFPEQWGNLFPFWAVPETSA
jgi:predicted LPLAT superfamily acyltransferase